MRRHAARITDLAYRALALPIVLTCLVLAPAKLAGALDHPLPTLYRLDSEASYEEGCFGPCLCPLYLSPDPRGTFKLRRIDRAKPAPVFDVYRVRSVNWWVTTPSGLTQVTGWGRYRIGGEVAVVERLVLHLRIGDRPVERFDSGFVPADGELPHISLTISNLADDQQCSGTRIAVSAAPVPLSERLRYRVEGDLTDVCCVCARLFDPTATVRGRFVLVDISTDDAQEYAVANVVWDVGSVSPLGPDRAHGEGIYRLREAAPAKRGMIGNEQRMTLSLRSRLSERTTFDSGWASGGDAFPRSIDTSLAKDGFDCIDRVLHIHADSQTP